ncbi:T-cell receptor alpha chain V region RL-5 [Microtus ochrogaster]|nr:T-cell receptor alpha chain V region RL-5 [Microtus ochrogaster]
MDTSPGFVTAILLLFGRTHGDSVTQAEDQMIISEGGFLTINCTYIITHIGSAALFWYVQYPGESLQFLLKVITAGAKGSSRGFEATYDEGSTSFHLQKASVQESDSAVYYCALRDTEAETAGGAEHKLKGSRWSGC